jgi:hypothetical protein
VAEKRKRRRKELMLVESWTDSSVRVYTGDTGGACEYE